MSREIGKRVVDISDLLDNFEAQEGEVQHIIGKTGQGKTYEGTRRALNYLYQGYTVYTTWRLNLPDYYDEREHLWPALRNFFLMRRQFYRFDLKNNWRYLNLDAYCDSETKEMDVQKLSLFVSGLTDCILFLDEGQDIFDSHKKSTAAARQTISRTRHMHKTLIVISQRAQAVDVTARANVTYFYKCEKRYLLFWAYFKVYRTDEVDESMSYPIWVRHDSQGRATWKAEVWHAGFAKAYIYAAYDSWYMRQQQIRSQDIQFDAYELGFFTRFRVLFRTMFFRPVKDVDNDGLDDNLKPYESPFQGQDRPPQPKQGTKGPLSINIRLPAKSTQFKAPRVGFPVKPV